MILILRSLNLLQQKRLPLTMIQMILRDGSDVSLMKKMLAVVILTEKNVNNDDGVIQWYKSYIKIQGAISQICIYIESLHINKSTVARNF